MCLYLCEDDCDLSCIVIMAKIRKEPDTVCTGTVWGC